MGLCSAVLLAGADKQLSGAEGARAADAERDQNCWTKYVA